jgi:PIN domain nuclease of toxin-antitoxin system
MMLLDTCAILWLAHDQSQFSAATLARIDAAPVVFVSAISGFEIGLKYRAGKLALPMPPGEWLREVAENHYLSILDLNLEVCLKATELAPVHKDPCDRFIIAAALTKGIPIVTADARFEEYGVEVLR